MVQTSNEIGVDQLVYFRAYSRRAVASGGVPMGGAGHATTWCWLDLARTCASPRMYLASHATFRDSHETTQCRDMIAEGLKMSVRGLTITVIGWGEGVTWSLWLMKRATARSGRTWGPSLRFFLEGGPVA